MNRSTRRQFLKSGGAVIATAILPTWGCDGNEVRFKSMPTGPDMDIMDMEEMPEEEALPFPSITSNARHYLQSIKGTNYDPRLVADSWRLVVDGLVDQPNRGWTYADITALPMNRQVLTMQCIGNWIGGPLVGNAEWGGTPLSEVLGLAGIKSGAIRVKFYSVDGYTTSIPLERALRDEVILAWEMNGEPLPSKHGFPLRLINPGHYGQKMPKWITRIELIDEVHLGHWESKPENKPFKWSDDAVATVNSRIDAPLSVWDDKKDPANGGVSRVLQTLRGAEGRPFVPSTGSPWPASSRSNRSRSAPMAGGLGLRHRLPRSACPTFGSRGPMNGICPRRASTTSSRGQRIVRGTGSRKKMLEPICTMAARAGTACR